MKPVISPNLIFRTPRFPWKDPLSKHWDELKAAIAVSSPDFYATIKDINALEIVGLPEKAQYTIWKYFNRARFRATPFGTFSAFGMARIEANLTNAKLIIANEFTPHQFVNWPHKNKLNFDLESLIRAGRIRVFSNTSAYKTKEFLRFVSKTDQRQFELQEIAGQEIIAYILEMCMVPVAIKDLIVTIDIDPTLESDLYGLLVELVESQLLLTELDPNIIGEDYFTRIGIGSVEEPVPYIISEVKALDGVIDQQLFRHIPEAVALLHGLSTAETSSSLDRFLSAFTEKFELKEIPIMVALDPELGVGYDELEQSTKEDDFIAQFGGRTAGKKVNTQDSIKNILSDRFGVYNPDTEATINLDDISVDKLKPSMPMANTINVLARINGPRVFLETIGGISATTLMGRFTLASENALSAAKEMAEVEKSSNPDVVFFDVAYIAETNVDNINRRRSIYDHQVSILNYDTSVSPLALNDIMVSVKGKEIVLRSKKLNKRLIPRIATAYNHSRSDFSPYRLFCDIQNQGIQIELSFSIERLFPDCMYYPEVSFKNLVLSPRMWRLTEAEVTSIAARKSISFTTELLSRKGICAPFKVGLSDQTLAFDPTSDIDLQAFVQYAATQKSMLLKEMNFPESSVMQNNNGDSFFGEYVINIVNRQQIYAGFSASADEEPLNELVEFFAPGSEWLYFEIFCHTRRADVLLTTAVKGLLREFDGDIKDWFFIRYLKNGHHIRLRLHLNSMDNYQQIVVAFNHLLSEELSCSWVSDLQIKTYRREISRYGGRLMEKVEIHFAVDSEYVLEILEKHLGTFDKYTLCIDLLFKIQSELFAPATFIDFLKRVSDGFNNEHHLSTSDFKTLNIRYQELLKNERPADAESPLRKAFVHSFISLIIEAREEERLSLVSNLFHMHVNRFFDDSQRTHEMVIYYFATKQALRRQALQKI